MIRPYLILLVLGLLLWFCVPGPVAAQTDLQAQSEVEYAFGQMMRFSLTAAAPEIIQHVTLFFRASEFPNTFSADVPLEPGREIHIEHTVDLSQVRLAPFTTVTYWWVLNLITGEEVVVPSQTVTYEDDQFRWRRLAQNGISVHWTGDDPGLGQLGLDIINEALPRLGAVIPLGESVAFDLYMYPTAADLRAALRLTGRDWVGAHAHPELGVIMVTAVNARTAATDLRQSIPHEMVHFLLYQVTGPAYETLPFWFNEGLATYLEAAPNPAYQTLLETAVAERNTIAFADLCYTFPADENRALLAYAQSASLLRFIQARYGTQALRELINAFADGADCHTGVQRVLQRSLDELDQAWLRDLAPRSPLAHFLLANSLWLLLLAGGFVITSLLVLSPHRVNRQTYK